jgi:hypothetical protein
MILQEAVGVSKQKAIPSLVLGESLNALVLSSSIERKALLQIKNSTVLADTPFPLQNRETLTVRVDQLYPIIVLRIITRDDAEISKIHEFLKLYRSNPGALKDMIGSVNDLLRGDNLRELGNYLSKKDILNFFRILNQIIVSKDNMKNPLFFKESIVALGLTDERRLMKALSDPSILKDNQIGLTLKQILMKLSSKLSPIQIASDHTDLDIQKIGQFSSIADHAATVIETLQIVNIMAQEQDGLFVLQIPFQFPDGIRTQDIFIEADREMNKQYNGIQCRIVLFLDLDALGELAVDAGLKDGILRCTIKCPDQNVCDFMQPLLPELREALSGIDYSTGSVECVLEQDIQSWKNDFLHDRNLFTQSVIDVCV